MADILKWLLPVNRLHRTRAVYSYASFGLHLGIIFVTFFLQNHVDVLEASLGLAWPATHRPLLDVLTLVTIVGASILLFYRVYVPGSRRLSGFMDYLLLILILGIYVSGYLAGRSWNPIPYDGLMLCHTLIGMLLLVLIPFSKIAHCALYPLVRLGSEVAWHLTPRGGSDVIQTLYGPEGRKI
jgi:nitrate reductase gamma subunit